MHAHSIISDMRVRVLSPGKHPELLSYDQKTGIYVVGDRPIEQAAEQLYMREQPNGLEVKQYSVTEIVGAVRRNADEISPNELNDPKREVVIFQNGVLDLNTLKVNPHSPEHMYTIGIPHNYNPDAKCPEFDRFVTQILPLDARKLLKQIIGYLLTPSTKYRKFVILIGSGANGKSTMITVICTLLGEDNVSHLPLHCFAGNQFATYELHGRLLNACADLDSADLKRAGLLKSIAAGDWISYERKFKNPFYGPVTARLLFSANSVPVIRDESFALFDRIILLEFPFRFEEEKQDKDLIQKLTTEEELEGIIAQYAVPGLLSLRDEGCFDIPARSKELLSEYRLRVDPILDFLQQRVEPKSDAWVSKAELYQVYQGWCESEGIRPKSQREFNQRVAAHLNISPSADQREPDGRRRIWREIQVKINQGPRYARLLAVR